MAHQGDGGPPGRGEHPERHSKGFDEVGDRLAREFAEVHTATTVMRCVAAARHGAQEVTGAATPDLVERIARKHLQVLAIVAAERRRSGPSSSLDNAP